MERGLLYYLNLVFLVKGKSAFKPNTPEAGATFNSFAAALGAA